jgi:hypothetical protein
MIWGPMVAPYMPQGSHYLGAEVRPPLQDAAQCLRAIIVPRYRPQWRNAAVLKEEPLSELAQASAAKYPELRGVARFTAARIRLAYEESGRAMEEDLYCVMMLAQVPMQGGYSIYWGPEEVRYAKAARGRLDALYPLFQAMAFSERLDLRWFNIYQQISQFMVQEQMAASNRALELSRYLSRVNNEISSIIRGAYSNRQAAMDRVNANWARHVRGVDEYANPWGNNNTQLPSGYDHAWANSRGEYLLSNDSNFNPNVGTNQEWRQMKRQ